MNFENIIITSESEIGQITINRPSKLNALNVATINELHHGLKDLDNNPEIRVFDFFSLVYVWNRGVSFGMFNQIENKLIRT